MAPDPHTAVKQELLVRYLDFWTPVALHSGRRATYLDQSGYGPAAAVRVFAEFADLLAGRELIMLVGGGGDLPADPGVAGLRVDRPPEDLAGALRRGPVLAHLDRAEVADAVLATLGAARGGELIMVTEPPPGQRPWASGGDPGASLRQAGFGYVVSVELVDQGGTVQLLRFATSAVKSVERFKDELWAVDEFAGIRYQDPGQPETGPVDISFEPSVGPLRRALREHLAGGSRTVAELREYALTRTLYRPADVVRAVTPLLAKGGLSRHPQRGRLTGDTVISLPG